MLLNLFLGLAAAGPLNLVHDCGASFKTKYETTPQETIDNAAALTSCLYQANNRSFEDYGPEARTVLLSKEHVV